EREMDTAIAAVDEGRAQICFLLNPVDVEQVTAMALAGEVLPQKSTDFYPKLLSGMTLYRMEGFGGSAPPGTARLRCAKSVAEAMHRRRFGVVNIKYCQQFRNLQNLVEFRSQI